VYSNLGGGNSRRASNLANHNESLSSLFQGGLELPRMEKGPLRKMPSNRADLERLHFQHRGDHMPRCFLLPLVVNLLAALMLFLLSFD